MTARHRRNRITLLAVSAPVACTGDAVTLCGCSEIASAAVLQGRGTGPDGAPAAGVVIVAELAGPGCGQAEARIGGAWTAEDGSYRTVIDGPPPGRTGGCFRALAFADSTTTVPASDTVPFDVRFSRDAALDRGRVNLVLRAP